MFFRKVRDTVFGQELMRPELRKEMIRVLEEASKGGAAGKIVHFGEEDDLGSEAIGVLKDSGALRMGVSDQYNITLNGYDYHLELKTPLRHWFKKNWFPAAVLVVATLANVFSESSRGHLTVIGH